MTQTQVDAEIHEHRECRLATWSFGLALVSLLCVIYCPVLIILLPVCGPAAVVLGIIAIVKIGKSKGRLRGLNLAFGGIGLALVVPALVTLWAWNMRFTNHKTICALKLRLLGNALSIYAGDSRRYPAADRWCDLLIENAPVSEGFFSCPSAPKGRSNYAINPDCEPNSPGDLVLLFETGAGWNQQGGPELLSFENHGGKGAHVLFNDLRVEFIEPGDLGPLKWKSQQDR